MLEVITSTPPQSPKTKATARWQYYFWTDAAIHALVARLARRVRHRGRERGLAVLALGLLDDDGDVGVVDGLLALLKRGRDAVGGHDDREVAPAYIVVAPIVAAVHLV